MRSAKKILVSIVMFATLVFVTTQVVGCATVADTLEDMSVGIRAMSENGANRGVAKKEYDYQTYQKPKR